MMVFFCLFFFAYNEAFKEVVIVLQEKILDLEIFLRNCKNEKKWEKEICIPYKLVKKASWLASKSRNDS